MYYSSLDLDHKKKKKKKKKKNTGKSIKIKKTKTKTKNNSKIIISYLQVDDIQVFKNEITVQMTIS